MSIVTMCSVKFTLVVVLSVLGKIHCSCGPPVAGKCRTVPYQQLQEEQLDQLTSVPYYDIIYSTDNTPFNTAVKVERALIPIGDKTLAVTDTFIFSDQTKCVYPFNITWIDSVFYEVSVDENEVVHEFRHYILATYSPDGAVLYYRCSDDGDPTLDTRAIELVPGQNLSESGLNYLCGEDSSIGFTYGTLSKIPLT